MGAPETWDVAVVTELVESAEVPELVGKFSKEKLVAGSSGSVPVACCADSSVRGGPFESMCTDPSAEIFHCQYSLHRGPQLDAKSTVMGWTGAEAFGFCGTGVAAFDGRVCQVSGHVRSLSADRAHLRAVGGQDRADRRRHGRCANWYREQAPSSQLGPRSPSHFLSCQLPAGNPSVEDTCASLHRERRRLAH